MVREHRSHDCNRYVMDYRDPHRVLEPLEQEIAMVDAALHALREAGAVPHVNYGHAKMLGRREAVREFLDIRWTAISPRMQRLLYDLNAIRQPGNMISAGVFCGNADLTCENDALCCLAAANALTVVYNTCPPGKPHPACDPAPSQLHRCVLGPHGIWPAAGEPDQRERWGPSIIRFSDLGFHLFLSNSLPLSWDAFPDTVRRRSKWRL
jgi:hypothetical protein